MDGKLCIFLSVYYTMLFDNYVHNILHCCTNILNKISYNYV